MMAHEYNLLRRILKERSGINLDDDKVDLVEARLRPVLKEFGFSTFSHLSLALMKPNADRLRSRVAQAVAVMESYFFRDKVPFAYFTECMLPRLMEKREASRRIRVWCAASATGQEPYSLAMQLAENEKILAGWTVEIVATDFVEDALQRAQQGLYSQFEIQRGLPVSMLVKYFRKVGNGWQIKPEIQAKVCFRAHNLLDDCQDLGVFDVIFCRNVLIYFDIDLKQAVLARLSRQLASDGYLVLGAAESVSGLSADFMPVPEGHHGVFCFTPSAAAVQAHQAAGRRKASQTNRQPPSDGDGGSPASGAQGPSRPDEHVSEQGAAATKLLTLELEKETADLLEARAKARNLSVADLIAEFVAAEGHMPDDWQEARLRLRAV